MQMEKMNASAENKLILMMGVPGSGKSTWAKDIVKNNKNIKYVSRDEIRFNLIDNQKNYFSKEDEVINIFSKTIRKFLLEGYTVIADATHITKGSRKKILNKIDLDYNKYLVNIFYRKVPLSLALEQNELRKNNKLAYVPRSAIKRMYAQLEPVDLEKEKYINKIIVNEEFDKEE